MEPPVCGILQGSWSETWRAFSIWRDGLHPNIPEHREPRGPNAGTPTSRPISCHETGPPEGCSRPIKSLTTGPPPRASRELWKGRPEVREEHPSHLCLGLLTDSPPSTLTNYLHDFYIHSFVVAKHWGRGPRADQWTAGLVSALTLGSFDMGSPASLESATSPAAISNWPDRLDAPTQLCQWVIHVRHVDYEPVPEPVVDAQDGFDIQDPRSWAEWPLDEPEQSSVSFTKSMQESIANNTFSLTPADELPIATELISQTVQQDPDSLQVDACKVAIMAGNVNLVIDLLPKLHPEGIENIHPFHLAASFLDGGKTCCSMITALSSELGPGYIFRNNHDDLGHTVIDTFMIAILRSHTSVSPEHVSTRFNPPHKFPAEEQDICGRWDPVSPAVRTLLRHGYPRIPTHWKHAFCHTAAQAICHSLIAILGSPVSPRINSLSGLFVRRCNTCGLELKLGPLHTLVVVTFHLAHRGLPGETLFGAMAMFVCLLSLGADASLKTTISVEDIFGQAKPDTCCHKPMDTADLIEAVPHDLVAQWSRDCQTGWACILQVLLLARSDGDGNSEDDSERDESDGDLDPDSEEGTRHNRCCGLGMKGVSAHDEWIVLPCGNPKLGLLWATIQVELLTYRRINIEDSWVSRRFSMDALKTWLEGGSSEFLTPLVEGRMMEEHSPCGWFHGDDFVCPVAEDVCKEHFMNMDVYDRTNFLPTPDLIDHWIDQC